jgi:hypothetical protein
MQPPVLDPKPEITRLLAYQKALAERAEASPWTLGSRKAKAEAERTCTQPPIDRFVQRFKAHLAAHGS